MTDTNNDKDTFLLRLNKVFANGKMTYNDRHELQQLHDTEKENISNDYYENQNRLTKIIVEKDNEIENLKWEKKHADEIISQWLNKIPKTYNRIKWRKVDL